MKKKMYICLQTETVKYFGIHFDRRLTWNDQVQTKRKQLEHKQER